MKVEEAKLKLDDVVLQMSVVELENAAVIFISEGSEKLGTVAFSLPRMGVEGTGVSSVLIGGKYHLSSRAIAERAAARFKKMTLVSVHTSLPESTLLKASIQLLDELKPL